jgi:hypothetical protein
MAAAATAASPPGASRRLAESLDEIQQLEGTFIHLQTPAVYSTAEHDHARAFVVLAHGVLEDYLEGICLEVVDAPLSAFKQDSRARTALLSLLTYRNVREAPPAALAKGPWHVREALKESRDHLRKRAADNNGIKEKDVLALLLPVGLKESDFDAAWLAAMNELGGLRGNVVHRGRRPGAMTPVTPDDAQKAVARVLPALCRADARLIALRDE